MDRMRKILPDKNILYYAAYIVWFSASLIFGRSTLEAFLGFSSVFWLKKVGYPVCAVLILIVMFQSFSLSDIYKNSKFDKEQLLKYGTAGLLAVIFGLSWKIAGTGTYFMLLMFVVAAKEIDLERLPKITVAMQCVLVPLIIILALTGTIENVDFMYERINQEPVYRQALGFGHPNALGAQIVHFCICWLWLRWEKWKWYDCFVYAAAVYFMYTICNSWTSVILITLIVCMRYLYKLLVRAGHTDLLEKFVSICIWIVPLLCVLISYLYSEESPVMGTLDHIASWRFKKANQLLAEYPATLLGSRLPDKVGADDLYVDVIVRYGVIVLFLIVFGIYLLMKYAIKKKMYPLIISIFIFVLYGITEHYPYLLMYNFTLLYLSVSIWGETVEEKKMGCVKSSWI